MNSFLSPYSIQLVKRQNSKPITVEDSLDVVMHTLSLTESIIFFINGFDSAEIEDNESFSIHLQFTTQLINELLSVISGEVHRIETRRKELEISSKNRGGEK